MVKQVDTGLDSEIISIFEKEVERIPVKNLNWIKKEVEIKNPCYCCGDEWGTGFSCQWCYAT